MKKAITLALLLAVWFLLGSALTWVNDGGDGWGTGSELTVAAADMDAIKTAVDDNDSRLDNLGDCSSSPCNLTNDTVALTTDTTGNYVASVTGDSEITASGTGEGAAVTLAIAATLTRDSELSALTVSTTDVTDLTTACDDGDIYIDTDGPSASGTPRIWFCIDGATENWAYEDLTD